MSLTVERLRSIAETLKKNAVQPKVVKSKSQAKRLTATDPVGKRWNVGEKYYIVIARS